MKSIEKIKGYAFQDVKTKHLVERLPKKSIAVIIHEDLDTTAAEMLINCKVKAVINLKASMSGLFNHDGVKALLQADISVFDVEDPSDQIELEGQLLLIKENYLYQESDGKWNYLCKLKPYCFNEIKRLKLKAKTQFPKQFSAFIENSLYYGERELEPFVRDVQLFPVLRQFKGKDVLVVARGPNYQKDLLVLKSLIIERSLLTIAVDGGADGLLKLGITPDFIIGDMDSVSERALKSGGNILVHTYREGHAPGENRVKSLKLPYKRIKFLGTSEDVAIIFAYCSGAKRLYSVGTRLGMNEFLEKGRIGMGSSLLTRVKVGHALVDLKGIHTLFEQGKKNISNNIMLIPAFVALLMLSFSTRFELFISIILQWWAGGGIIR